ncbi:MAG TPA: hypothetical protein H9780_01410 [Candidatus Mediterraneibacter merdavium]|nr:hypothetical protein [Candidatus Mediterraneibacter merdavium]
MKNEQLIRRFQIELIPAVLEDQYRTRYIDMLKEYREITVNNFEAVAKPSDLMAL